MFIVRRDLAAIFKRRFVEREGQCFFTVTGWDDQLLIGNDEMWSAIERFSTLSSIAMALTWLLIVAWILGLVVYDMAISRGIMLMGALFAAVFLLHFLASTLPTMGMFYRLRRLRDASKRVKHIKY